MHFAGEPHADVLGVLELRVLVEHVRRVAGEGRGQPSAHVRAHQILPLRQHLVY